MKNLARVAGIVSLLGFSLAWLGLRVGSPAVTVVGWVTALAGGVYGLVHMQRARRL